MATKDNDKSEGRVGRLAERGEEAVTRLMEEVGKSTRVTDTLHRVMSAKGRLDTASRGALSQMGIAPADELKDLRKQLASLERRLAKLEASSGKPTTKRSTTKSQPTAARKTTRAKKPDEQAASPAAGRSVGGGTARGGSAGGGSAAA